MHECSHFLVPHVSIKFFAVKKVNEANVSRDLIFSLGFEATKKWAGDKGSLKFKTS